MVAVAVSAQDKPLHVAVVGAGAAGLAAAHEALRASLRVTVLEAEDDLGGVWRYTDAVESDPLGQDPKRRRVQSSMYRDLRCNLPRQCMAFLDFPFLPEAMLGKSEDGRVFCSHAEVMAYLRAFAEQFDLLRHIQFRTGVKRIQPLQQGAPENGSKPKYTWPRWQLQLQQGSQEQQIEVDAVMVCNGHYTEPKLARLPGQDAFTGLLMHTHNYRSPHPFTGKRVVVVGAAASGVDISLEIAQVADQVWLCSRSWPEEADLAQPIQGSRENMWRRGPPSELSASGAVQFEGGEAATEVDVILFATGYQYSLPFLGSESRVAAQDNRVGPLYKHVLVPHWGPSLALLGLPFKVAPFPLYQAQARWVAALLSGAAQLGSEAEMLADSKAWDEEVASNGFPVRYTHMMGEQQWEYLDWLLQQADPAAKPMPGYRQELYKEAQVHRSASPESYRDRRMPGPALDCAAQEAAAWLQGKGTDRTAAVV